MKPSDYEFAVGDKVITTYGEVGKIVDICTCDFCVMRGFNEPTWVEDEFGDYHYITITDANLEFNDFYQIGKYRFNNRFNKLAVSLDVNQLEKQLMRRKKQLSVIEGLEKEVINEQ